MARAGIYEIRLEGHLAGNWSDWFGGLSIHNEPGDGAILKGPIVDQAALIGLLTKVHAMNLTITSVRRLPAQNESDDGRKGGQCNADGVQRSLKEAKSIEREGDSNET